MASLRSRAPFGGRSPSRLLRPMASKEALALIESTAFSSRGFVYLGSNPIGRNTGATPEAQRYLGTLALWP